MEQLVSYIRPELVLLIPVLYFVGMGLKKTALVQDRWIPLFVCGVGVALSALYTFATGELTSLRQGALLLFTAVTQGVLVSGASVLCHQLYKQATKKQP